MEKPELGLVDPYSSDAPVLGKSQDPDIQGLRATSFPWLISDLGTEWSLNLKNLDKVSPDF